MTSIRKPLRVIWQFRCWIFLLIAVLAPSYLVTGSNTKQSRCAYIIIVMAILWLTEAIPIPVTALLPIFMFPMLQVVDAKEISAAYINDTSMLFLGGLMLAVAVEEWNFHRRIALSVMSLIGACPSMLMIGLMLPTWFLSMWISNTAATSMMIPIIEAVVTTLEEVNKHAEKTNPQGRKPFLIRFRKDPKTKETRATLVKVTTVPNFHSTNGDAVTEKANMKHRDTLPLLHVNGNGLVRSDELDSGEVTSSPNVKRYDDPTIQH